MCFTLADHLERNMTIHGPSSIVPEYYVLPILPVNSTNIEEYQVSTIGIGVDITCGVVPANDISLVCEDEASGGTTACADTPSNDAMNVVIVDGPCWEHSLADISRMRRQGGLNIQRTISTEEYKWSGISLDDMVQSSKCPGTFFALWLEQPANPHPTSQALYLDRRDALVLKCETVNKIVELTATIDAELQVLSMAVVRQFNTSEVTAWYPSPVNSTTQLSSSFISSTIDGLERDNSLDPHNLHWFNNLMVVLNHTIAQNLTNITHISDAAVIAGALEDVYRKLFAVNLQLYMRDIISPGEQLSRTVPAAALIRMGRVNVSQSNFAIAVFILLVIIVVLVVLYSTRQQPVGHVPTSLAKMYALLYASNTKDLCRDVDGADPKERAENLEKHGERYMYGPIPGGIHYGVYRDGIDEKTRIPMN